MGSRERGSGSSSRSAKASRAASIFWRPCSWWSGAVFFFAVASIFPARDPGHHTDLQPRSGTPYETPDFGDAIRLCGDPYGVPDLLRFPFAEIRMVSPDLRTRIC